LGGRPAGGGNGLGGVSCNTLSPCETAWGGAVRSLGHLCKAAIESQFVMLRVYRDHEPSRICPDRISTAIGSNTSRWMARFSGPRAIRGIVALFGQQIARRIRQLDLDAPFRQPLGQAFDLHVDNPPNVFARQWVEHHDVIHAVQKLRPEMAPEHAEHFFNCLFIMTAISNTSLPRFEVIITTVFLKFTVRP